MAEAQPHLFATGLLGQTLEQLFSPAPAAVHEFTTASAEKSSSDVKLWLERLKRVGIPCVGNPSGAAWARAHLNYSLTINHSLGTEVLHWPLEQEECPVAFIVLLNDITDWKARLLARLSQLAPGFEWFYMIMDIDQAMQNFSSDVHIQPIVCQRFWHFRRPLMNNRTRCVVPEQTDAWDAPALPGYASLVDHGMSRTRFQAASLSPTLPEEYFVFEECDGPLYLTLRAPMPTPCNPMLSWQRKVMITMATQFVLYGRAAHRGRAMTQGDLLPKPAKPETESQPEPVQPGPVQPVHHFGHPANVVMDRQEMAQPGDLLQKPAKPETESQPEPVHQPGRHPKPLSYHFGHPANVFMDRQEMAQPGGCIVRPRPRSEPERHPKKLCHPANTFMELSGTI